MRASPSPAEVEAYLHQHIPLSADMGVRVVACDNAGVTLRAPLAPNINHRSTVFGGSTSAMAILAAWTWLNFALRAVGPVPRLVIQRNTVDYLAPIIGEFESHCAGLPAEKFASFRRTLERHGKARATLATVLSCKGAKVAEFSGEFVALR
jgi:thioesterase domain-containing protein